MQARGAKKGRQALPLSRWIEATGLLHLALGDVRAWRVGNVHRLACLDRGIDDRADRHLTSRHVQRGRPASSSAATASSYGSWTSHPPGVRRLA